MSKVKVIRLTSLEGPKGISIVEEELPKPKSNEVSLDIKALGLNRAESMFSRGEYPVEAKLPSLLGLEGVGVIKEIGSEVKGFKVGDRVVALCPNDVDSYGMAGQVAIAREDMLVPDIPELSNTELAAFYIAYLTAYDGLIRQGKLQKSKTALITASSSSVGIAAIQIANAIGARAVVTTRKEAKKQLLLDAGADRVIVTDNESIADSGESYNLVFDAVGGTKIINEYAPLVAEDGIIIIYGALGGDPEPIFPLFPAIFSNLSMTSFHVGFHTLRHPERLKNATEFLKKGIKDGSIKPKVDRVFPFEEISNAYSYLENSEQFGKIIVELK